MTVIEVAACLPEASGITPTVSNLSEHVRRQGADVQLHVLAPAPASVGDYRIQSHPSWSVLSKLGISPAMKRALHESAQKAEIMHSHGLWMMPNIYPASAVRGKACRLITSIHGTLSEWALKWHAGRKRVFWLFAQGRALRSAHAIHATAESEYCEVRAAGLKAPVAIIPFGIDIPAVSNRIGGGARRLLFLGRLHPKKGIDILLRAWHQIERNFPEWELHIVGLSAPGYQEQLESLAKSLGVCRVYFPGPSYGPDKSRQYHQADLFVLPTHSENFGVSVTEALAHGVPAIVSKGAPWSGLETHNCGWWIEHGVDPLVECLRTALALSAEKLHEMGRLGRQWMEREFSWEMVGERMFETYRWLVGRGTPPSWVQIN